MLDVSLYSFFGIAHTFPNKHEKMTRVSEFRVAKFKGLRYSHKILHFHQNIDMTLYLRVPK